MLQVSQLKARDIMQTDVVRLDASAPITEAIATLEDLEFTGAPVVDSSGRLVGVLSTRDVTRAEHVRAGRIAPEHGDWALTEPSGEEVEEDGSEQVILDKEDYSPAVMGQDTVRDWMNPRVVIVEPESTVKEVCRRMLKDHIHRVIVSKNGKLEGIITSFDIVRCIAEGG